MTRPLFHRQERGCEPLGPAAGKWPRTTLSPFPGESRVPLRGQTPPRADVGEPCTEETDATPSSYSSQHGGEREGATDPKHRVAVSGKAWMCSPLPKSTSQLDSGFWARKSSLGSDGAFRAQERHPPACVCPSCLHGAAPPAEGKQWVYKYADGLLIRPWPPMGTSVPWRPGALSFAQPTASA